MYGLSKAQQTKKQKRINPKKMTKLEYNLFVDFVNSISNGMCQCGCGRKADDIHHGVFGAGGRDDRTLGAISRHCHTIIHHGTDIDEASRLKLLFKQIGKQNYKEYVS